MRRLRLSGWLVIVAALCPFAAPLAEDFAPLPAVAPPDAPNDEPPRAAPVPAGNLFSPAQIIAKVGKEHIFAGDVLPTINQMLEPYLDKIPAEELDKQRLLLLKRQLLGAIETKLVYLDFLRLAPPDKVPEIHRNVAKKFDSERIPELLEKTNLATAQELDSMLRKYGSSLAKSRRMFTEQVLGHSMVGRNVKQNPEVSHEEMLAYYREHAADYEMPAKVRWEELMTEIGKFPDRRDAYAALAAMGNEVLRGAKLDAVAKRGSHGFTADQGGYRDWTTRGSLVSKVVDNALFTMPEGKLSEILEDEGGFYILRVIERRAAGRVPFTEAQVEIKKKLTAAKQDKDRQAYLDKLRRRTPVWTVFDEPDAPLYVPTVTP